MTATDRLARSSGSSAGGGSGGQTSNERASPSPGNRSAATPTIVYARLPTNTVLPSTSGSPSNARRQSRYPITAAGAADGAVSAAVNSRPIAGPTPSTSKYSPVTALVAIRSAPSLT